MNAPPEMVVTFKANPRVYKYLLKLYKKNKLIIFFKSIQRKILKILFPKCLIIKIQNQTEYDHGNLKNIELQDAEIVSYGPYWYKNHPKYVGVRIYYE